MLADFKKELTDEGIYMGPSAKCDVTIHACKNGHVRFDINYYRRPSSGPECLDCIEKLNIHGIKMHRIDRKRVDTLTFFLKLYHFGTWTTCLKTIGLQKIPSRVRMFHRFQNTRWFNYFKTRGIFY